MVFPTSLRRLGFNLAEVVLAVGLVSVLILSLAALILSTLRSNQKATTLAPAAQAAERILTEELYSVQNDLPAGSRDAFWNNDGVWKDTTLNEGGVSYQFVLERRSALGVAPNRIKKVDLTVWWLNTRGQSGMRQGTGKEELHLSRLISEAAP